MNMNKQNYIKRKVDNIGRIKIPMELLEKMYLNKKDSVEFFVKGDLLILKKYIR